MKLAKKALAAVLACVMVLCLLTACSGSSGGSEDTIAIEIINGLSERGINGITTNRTVTEVAEKFGKEMMAIEAGSLSESDAKAALAAAEKTLASASSEYEVDYEGYELYGYDITKDLTARKEAVEKAVNDFSYSVSDGIIYKEIGTAVIASPYYDRETGKTETEYILFVVFTYTEN